MDTIWHCVRRESQFYTGSMPTVFSAALLEILVCPVCHQPVELGHADTNAENAAREDSLSKNMSHEWLRCRGCGLCYPIQDGIPVMLEERATRTSPPS
jgi:uncharacterized protein YbaR (Trm112 family)